MIILQVIQKAIFVLLQAWVFMQLEKNKVLVRRLQLDDSEAFNALYYEYHQAVFANIQKLIHDKATAKDILQEVFLTLWEHRSSLDPEQSVAGWLFVVSYNKSVTYLDKAIRRAEILRKAAPVIRQQQEVDYHEQRYSHQLKIVTEAIDKLPPRKKIAYCLCKLEGLSYEQAGVVLGISTNTVKEYIKTSNKLLREYTSTDQSIILSASSGLILLLMS